MSADWKQQAAALDGKAGCDYRQAVSNTLGRPNEGFEKAVAAVGNKLGVDWRDVAHDSSGRNSWQEGMSRLSEWATGIVVEFVVIAGGYADGEGSISEDAFTHAGGAFVIAHVRAPGTVQITDDFEGAFVLEQGDGVYHVKLTRNLGIGQNPSFNVRSTFNGDITNSEVEITVVAAP